MKNIKKIVCVLLCLLSVVFSINIYAAETYKTYGELSSTCEDAGNGDITNTFIKYKNNDIFCISKLSPYWDNSNITNEIFIPGEHIKVSFFDSQQNFVTQYTHENLPLKTLYVSTSKCNAVISIGAVYNVDLDYSTIVPVTEKEVPLTAEAVTSPERGYIFKGQFNLDLSEIAEMWYLISENINTPFYSTEHEFTMNAIKINEMSGNTLRLCHDGFYFEAPTSYMPYREGMLYKQPSCYTGVSYSRYGSCPMMNELGYAIMRLSAQNQNDDGFWETTLTVDWLNADFNITNNFYDTRFNTDFATGLAETYVKFQDEYFLNSLFKYTNFFIGYTQNNHIETENGWLICDYGAKTDDYNAKKTHSSLNHHTAEIIYLNQLYDVITGLDKETAEKFSQYEFVKNPSVISQLSEKMLNGIRDTEDYWIMENGNLEYAYGYEGSANVMTDYPYLTYNDLFNLNKQIKAKTGSCEPVLERLMDSKMQWMTENNITGYLTA